MAVTYSVILTSLMRTPEHKKTVKECLRAVKDYTPWEETELIVSDDGSPMDMGFLRKEADIYIRRHKPLGCAWGWNQGIKVANGDYYIILSDDVIVSPGWIECMRGALDRFPRAMAAAPRVDNLPYTLAGPHEYRVWFPGSIFMLRKETVEKIGYFDTLFHPFNYEDVDYWTRIYKAGYTVARDYSVLVWHKEGQVIHNLSYSEQVNQANRERYLKKWGFDPIPILYGGDKFPWESS